MAAVCAVVVLVTTLRHRRVGDDDDPSETPDVIEYMTMMIGVVYA
ncbi:membrane protein, partial [Streptomyces sp. NRRL WC-3753]